MAHSPLALLQRIQTLTSQQLRTSPWTFRRLLNFQERSGILHCFGPEQNPESEAPLGVVRVRLTGSPDSGLVHGWISIQGAPDTPCSFDLPVRTGSDEQLLRICTKLASDLDLAKPSPATR